MGLSILVGVTKSAYICCCSVSLPFSGACSNSCRVRDAIQPSHPLSSSSPPAFSLSQHHGLFQWVSSLHHINFACIKPFIYLLYVFLTYKNEWFNRIEYTYVYVCIYTLYIYVCVCMCVCVYIYIYIYTHTHQQNQQQEKRRKNSVRFH